MDAYLAPSPDLRDKMPERTGRRKSELYVAYEAHGMEVLETPEHSGKPIQRLVCHGRGSPSGCRTGRTHRPQHDFPKSTQVFNRRKQTGTGQRCTAYVQFFEVLPDVPLENQVLVWVLYKGEGYV